MRRGGLTVAITCTMGPAAVRSCPPGQIEPSGPLKPRRGRWQGEHPVSSRPGRQWLGPGLQALDVSGVSCCRQDTETRGLLPRRPPSLSPQAPLVAEGGPAGAQNHSPAAVDNWASQSWPESAAASSVIRGVRTSPGGQRRPPPPPCQPSSPRLALSSPTWPLPRLSLPLPRSALPSIPTGGCLGMEGGAGGQAGRQLDAEGEATVVCSGVQDRGPESTSTCWGVGARAMGADVDF